MQNGGIKITLFGECISKWGQNYTRNYCHSYLLLDVFLVDKRELLPFFLAFKGTNLAS